MLLSLLSVARVFATKFLQPPLIVSQLPKIQKTPVFAPVAAASNVLKSEYSTKSEAIFTCSPFKLHKLDKGPCSTTKLTAKDAMDIYTMMVTCRRMETSANTLYKERKIRGFCHLYAGQEAVAVGMRSVMRDVDSAITAYRCHAWTYLMGATVLQVLSELAGRGAGVSKGKGGSMHMYTRNFYGGNGIVGAQGPLGAGVAFANKYKEDGGICFTLYGDGAANQGQLFEAYNMAMLWKLPCIFVCENNIYAMGTKMNRAAASTEFYTRADYVPGIWVDGMDVLSTREATLFCIDYIACGKGPLVVEMSTYRYYGHSMSDPGTSYRTRDEVSEVRKTRDPINLYKEKILSAELVTAEQLQEVDKKIKDEVNAITDQARKEAEPPLEDLTKNVYVNPITPDTRGNLPY